MVSTLLKALVLAMVSTSLLVPPAFAHHTKKSVSKRLEALEKRTNENVTFVSSGRLILFGVEVPTTPPTEEELDEREESDRD